MASFEDAVDLAVLRRLHTLIDQVNSSRSLTETLHAIVDGVVEAVGFEVAAVNYVQVDDTFVVLAVAGSDAAREQLLGWRSPADAFEREFAIADQWGALLFVPHERLPGGEGEGWVPTLEPLNVSDAWHPQDALFAPLRSPAGDLVGVLSVDLPRDRRKPGVLQREMLEMFAAQAGIAIDNARLTERLQASEEAFRLAFERAGIGMALFRFSEADLGRYFRVNDAFCRIVGRTEQELLTLRFIDITHPDDRARDLAALEDARMTARKNYQVEKRYIRGDGSTVWVAVTSAVVSDAPDGGQYVIVQIENINERRAAREELTHRVGHDDLTGLPNRHTAYQRLAAAVDDAQTSGIAGALLFCDVDGFKNVNDTYGHSAGDRVLIVIAQRLAGVCRSKDTVARLGGDEFVVLAEDTTPAKARQLAERLRRAVAQPVVVDGVSVQLTVSIGIADLRDHADPSELMRRADADMYRARRSGGSQV